MRKIRNIGILCFILCFMAMAFLVAWKMPEDSTLSRYRALYAKPINEWSAPNIDSSVKDWKEFAPLPKFAPFPEDNPFSPIKAFLGRTLFNETRLSKSGQFSCESCHHRELASSDHLPRAFGHNGALNRRNAPNTQMSGFFPLLFWDGRAKSLEEQALMPITDPVEMANTLPNAENAIKDAPEYYALFVAAFGDKKLKSAWAQYYPHIFKQESQNAVTNLAQNNANVRIVPSAPKVALKGTEKLNLSPRQKQDWQNQADEIFGSKAFNTAFGATKKPKDDREIIAKMPQSAVNGAKNLITIENIAKALATFERSFGIARQSRFSDFLQGDYEKLSDLEIWGLDIFRNKGRCMNCHYGAILSDGKFHNIGLDFYGRELQDLGRYEITKNPADLGAFKTPSLVNVAKTAPYFHNGIAPSLNGVLALFNEAFPIPKMQGTENDPLLPKQSPLIKPLNLSAEEIEALEAFLGTL